MSYKSRVDVRISRIPEVPEEKFYPIFQEVFNAIHILNANIDPVVDILVPPDIDKDPSESFAPRTNTFWAPAADNVTVGRAVSMSGAQFKRGVAGYTAAPGIRVTDPFGICLEDATEGKARIAWPPFVLDVDLSTTGAGIGDDIHTDHTGSILYIAGNTESKYWAIGKIVATNMILFIPNMRT